MNRDIHYKYWNKKDEEDLQKAQNFADLWSVAKNILNKLDNKNINNPTSADTTKNNALSPLSSGLATPAPEFAGIDNWLNSKPSATNDECDERWCARWLGN
jgi:hypothetical protein